MSVERLRHDLRVAVTLHRSGSSLRGPALRDVIRWAQCHRPPLEAVEAAAIATTALVCLGECVAEEGDVDGGLAMIEAAADGAVHQEDWAAAATAFRSLAGAALRANQPLRAIAAGEHAADCSARDGDADGARRSSEFVALWRSRVQQWPEHDWGAWVRSG